MHCLRRGACVRARRRKKKVVVVIKSAEDAIVADPSHVTRLAPLRARCAAHRPRR
jgi:hypothetical protein